MTNAEESPLWLAVEVGCAECAGGDAALVFPLGVFTSLEDAKEALKDRVRGPWGRRLDYDGVTVLPGVGDFDGQGGIEIFPLPGLTHPL